MSVSFTEQAVVERRKTVTRRKGWLFLKPGDRLALCRKVMGRKKDEPLVRIAEAEVVSVRRESLALLYDAFAEAHCRECRYANEEVAREGFPGMYPREFVERYFIDAQGMRADDLVTRIQWRYLDEGES